MGCSKLCQVNNKLVLAADCHVDPWWVHLPPAATVTRAACDRPAAAATRSSLEPRRPDAPGPLPKIRRVRTPPPAPPPPPLLTDFEGAARVTAPAHRRKDGALRLRNRADGMVVAQMD